MKHNEFMKSIVDYYGEYQNDVVKNMTTRYLQSKFEEKDLNELLGAIYLEHLIVWGSPGIAAINKANKSYKKEKIDENKQLLEAKETSIFNQDLSISDEEWKAGFPGLEALKKAVHVEEDKKTPINTHIPHCKDCKYHPIQTKEGFEESKECVDCGQYKANFKQRMNDD